MGNSNNYIVRMLVKIQFHPCMFFQSRKNPADILSNQICNYHRPRILPLPLLYFHKNKFSDTNQYWDRKFDYHRRTISCIFVSDQNLLGCIQSKNWIGNTLDEVIGGLLDKFHDLCILCWEILAIPYYIQHHPNNKQQNNHCYLKSDLFQNHVDRKYLFLLFFSLSASI